ncbi:TIGR03032 family protein [Caenimonas aquaedulcis]|uniref:TIGR03032 family protein n=1 Tax=Caenimonas aquaedulcis TaxID=2793270 RepID=UPI0018C9A3D4|nr:TIGR03032 family protein [Caenimonas aquaedulcis]
MAGRYQIWRFDNLLAEDRTHEGGDRLYVPAASFTTGDVNAHEVAVQADGRPLFVNTAFSCLATLGTGSSFVPTWRPPFITRLAADDRCHLNGMALVDGVATWATACGSNDRPAGWREQRTGGGVLLHIPSNRIAARGLSMPHSPRWHQGKLWLLNSGTGELGWIDQERFVPLCFLPGFPRGLAFVGRAAVVGLSRLRSPQFGGLPLQGRLSGTGSPAGRCGLRVIDLNTGAVLHQLDLPEPLDELFDVAVLPRVRQPRALGLQAEDIQCLVKLPGRDSLVTVRPKAPSGHPHQAMPVPPAGLPVRDSIVRYQQVFQLTPESLAPYASLTFPSLAPGSAGLAALTGELLGVSAMAGGTMVGMALAERLGDQDARVCSLMVEPGFRRRGIATRLVLHLQRLLAQRGLQLSSSLTQ